MELITRYDDRARADAAARIDALEAEILECRAQLAGVLTLLERQAAVASRLEQDIANMLVLVEAARVAGRLR